MLMWIAPLLILSSHFTPTRSFTVSRTASVTVGNSITPGPYDYSCPGAGCTISVMFSVVRSSCTYLGLQVSVVPTDYSANTASETLKIYAGSRLLQTCGGYGQNSGQTFADARLCYSAYLSGFPTTFQLVFAGGSAINFNSISGQPSNHYIGVRVQWRCYTSNAGLTFVSYSSINNAPVLAPAIGPSSPTVRPTSRPTRRPTTASTSTGVIVGSAVGAFIFIIIVVVLAQYCCCAAAAAATVASTQSRPAVVTAVPAQGARMGEGNVTTTTTTLYAQTTPGVAMTTPAQPYTSSVPAGQQAAHPYYSGMAQPMYASQPQQNVPYAVGGTAPGAAPGAAPMYGNMQPQYQPGPASNQVQQPMYQPYAQSGNPGMAPGSAQPQYQPVYPSQSGAPGAARQSDPPAYAPTGNPGGGYEAPPSYNDFGGSPPQYNNAPPPAYGGQANAAPPTYGSEGAGGTGY